MYHFFSTKKEMALCAIKEKIYPKFEAKAAGNVQDYSDVIDILAIFILSFKKEKSS